MTVFTCVLVSDTGYYTQGEALIFGAPQSRAKTAETLTTKSKTGGRWSGYFLLVRWG